PQLLLTSLFPYTTLFRSVQSTAFYIVLKNTAREHVRSASFPHRPCRLQNALWPEKLPHSRNTRPLLINENTKTRYLPSLAGLIEDRKSTRLNSSHVKISY